MSACECRQDGIVFTICEPCLKKRIADLLAEFPMLADWKSDCCNGTGCTSSRVGEQYGPQAAQAWRELKGLNFLDWADE